MKILIIDDQTANIEYLKVLIKDYGTCDQTTDGLEGIEILKRATQSDQNYDLLLLDLTMPEVHGYTVLAEVRKMQAHLPTQDQTKVVIVSASGDFENIKKSLREGSDFFVASPVNRKDLTDVMDWIKKEKES